MRAFFRSLRKWIWRFMIIFSFVVNIILVIVLLFLGAYLFTITNDIANPLVSGLHSSFVALSEADIDWTIPVRDTIDVKFTVPLEKDTVVVLTQPVELSATAQIILNNSPVNTPVSLTLPIGLRLPVRLDLDVDIDQTLPVSLDVRAVIPLDQTQLADVAGNLRLLFEPLAYGLNNLPNDWGEATTMMVDWVNGTPPPNLITQPNPYSEQPWPGFSTTAGENYPFAYENQRLNARGVGPVQETGIVLQGGIQWLDMQLPERAYLYTDGCNPEAFNVQSAECASAQAAQPPLNEGDANSIGGTPQVFPTSTPINSAPLQPTDMPAATTQIMPTTTPGLFPTSTLMTGGEEDTGIIVATPAPGG